MKHHFIDFAGMKNWYGLAFPVVMGLYFLVLHRLEQRDRSKTYPMETKRGDYENLS
jgi:hypothetical protein